MKKKKERETAENENVKKRGGALALLCTLAALVLAAGAFCGGWFGYSLTLDEEVRTFLWAKDIAEKNYYKEIDEDALYSDLFDILDLDPYSSLYTPSGYTQYQDHSAGRYTDVGAVFSDLKDGDKTLVQVYSYTQNSPADRAGMRTGMFVFGWGATKEDAAADADGGNSALHTFMNGQEEDFYLRFGYERDGSDARTAALRGESYQAAFCHYRDSETSYSFRYESGFNGGNGKKFDGALAETGMSLEGLNGRTAYIRIDHFSGFAAEEFAACLRLMKSRGRQDLILDLRANGGGYMDAFCSIASHLLRNGSGKSPTVAKAVFRNGSYTSYNAYGNDFYDYFTEDSRVYVLADAGTASASECLIGALVDYGTTSFSDIFLASGADGTARTYGKGIMQRTYNNLNGAAMKLTVATISWPLSGKCIHGTGVTPADGANALPFFPGRGRTDGALAQMIGEINR